MAMDQLLNVQAGRQVNYSKPKPTQTKKKARTANKSEGFKQLLLIYNIFIYISSMC